MSAHPSTLLSWNYLPALEFMLQAVYFLIPSYVRSIDSYLFKAVKVRIEYFWIWCYRQLNVFLTHTFLFCLFQVDNFNENIFFYLLILWLWLDLGCSWRAEKKLWFPNKTHSIKAAIRLIQVRGMCYQVNSTCYQRFLS